MLASHKDNAARQSFKHKDQIGNTSPMKKQLLEINNDENRINNAISSPKVAGFPQSGFSSPLLTFEELSRTPKELSAKKKKNSRQTADATEINDILGLNNSSMINETEDNTQFSTVSVSEDFTCQTAFSIDELVSSRNNARRQTFEGNVDDVMADLMAEDEGEEEDKTGSTAGIMNKSDLISFSPLPVAKQDQKKPSTSAKKTPNRRETADFADLQNILGSLTDSPLSVDADSSNGSLLNASTVSDNTAFLAHEASVTSPLPTVGATSSPVAEEEQSMDISLPVSVAEKSSAKKASKSSANKTAPVVSGDSLFSPPPKARRQSRAKSVTAVPTSPKAAAPASLPVTPKSRGKTVMPSPRRSPRFVHNVNVNTSTTEEVDLLNTTNATASPGDLANLLQSSMMADSDADTDADADESCAVGDGRKASVTQGRDGDEESVSNSTASSLFAGFQSPTQDDDCDDDSHHHTHKTDGRRTTVDEHDMQAMLNDLANDESYCSEAVDQSASIAAQEAVFVSEMMEDATSYSVMSDLSMTSTVSVLSTKSQTKGKGSSSDKSSKKGRKSVSLSAASSSAIDVGTPNTVTEAPSGTVSTASSASASRKRSVRKSVSGRRQTAAPSDMAELLRAVEEDTSTEHRIPTGADRRNTADPADLATLMAGLNDSSLNQSEMSMDMSTASGDSIGTYALMSSVEEVLSQPAVIAASFESSTKVVAVEETTTSIVTVTANSVTVTASTVSSNGTTDSLTYSEATKSAKVTYISSDTSSSSSSVSSVPVPSSVSVAAGKTTSAPSDRRTTIDPTDLSVLGHFLEDSHSLDASRLSVTSSSVVDARRTTFDGTDMSAFNHQLFDESMSMSMTMQQSPPSKLLLPPKHKQTKQAQTNKAKKNKNSRMTIDGTDMDALTRFLEQDHDEDEDENNHDESQVSREDLAEMSGRQEEADHDDDGNATMDANDLSLFNDGDTNDNTVSMLGDEDFTTTGFGDNVNVSAASAAGAASPPVVPSPSAAEESDVYDTNNESMDGNETVDGRDLSALLNTSSDTLCSINTVDTYALMEGVEAEIEAAHNSEMLNTSDLTCGTVGSLGGWLAEAEELLIEQSVCANENTDADTNADIDVNASTVRSGIASSARDSIGVASTRNKGSGKKDKKSATKRTAKRDSSGFAAETSSTSSSGSKKRKLLVTKSPVKAPSAAVKIAKPQAASSAGTSKAPAAVTMMKATDEEHTVTNMNLSLNQSFTGPIAAPRSALKSCLSTSKYPLHRPPRENLEASLLASATKKSVIFGSPNVAEFNKTSPTTNMTPLDRKQAKSMFSMHCGGYSSDDASTAALSDVREENEEDEEDSLTAENSRQLEEWDRLSYASGNEGSDDERFFGSEFSPLASPPAESAEPLSEEVSASKRRRRSSSKFQPMAMADLSTVDEDFTADSSRGYLSDCTNTVDLPDNLMVLLEQSECYALAAKKNTVSGADGADGEDCGLDMDMSVSRTEDLEGGLSALMRHMSSGHSDNNDSDKENEDDEPQSLQDLSRSVRYSGEGDDDTDCSGNSRSLGPLLGLAPSSPATAGHGSLRLSVSTQGDISAEEHDQHPQQSQQMSVLDESGFLNDSQADDTMMLAERYATAVASGGGDEEEEDGDTMTLENNLSDLLNSSDLASPAGAEPSMPAAVIESEPEAVTVTETADVVAAAVAKKKSGRRESRSKGRKSLNTSTRIEVDEDVSFIVRNNTTNSAQTEAAADDADESADLPHMSADQSTEDVTEEMQQQQQQDEEDDVSTVANDISTASTMVDDSSRLFNTSVEEVLNMSVERNKAEKTNDMLSRIRSLNAGARSNALSQCATPSNPRMSIGMKRISMGMQQSAVKAARPSLIPPSAAQNNKRAKRGDSSFLASAPAAETSFSLSVPAFTGNSSQTSSAPPLLSQDASLALATAKINTSDLRLNDSVNANAFGAANNNVNVEVDVDVSLSMNDDTVALDPEETSMAATESNESVMMTEAAATEETAADAEQEVSLFVDTEALATFQVALRANLSRYFSLIQAIKSGISKHSETVQNIVIAVMQRAMRTSHLQCNIAAHITYDTLDTAWTLIESEIAPFIESQVAALSVDSKSNKRSVAAVLASQEEQDISVYSTKIVDWDQFWVNVSAIAILEHVDAIRDSATTTTTAGVSSETSNGNSGSDSALSLLESDEKFYSKALDTSFTTIATTRKTRNPALLALTSSALVTSSQSQTATATAAASVNVSATAESRQAAEKKLIRTRKMIEIANRLTYCRVVTFQSTCIEVNAILSTQVHANLKFSMSKDSSSRALTVCDMHVELVVASASTDGSDVSESQLVENQFVAGYFASVLCSEALSGPMSGTVLSQIEKPAQIPALLQKISCSISTLRIALQRLKALQSSTHNSKQHDVVHTVSIRKLNRPLAEHEVIVTVSEKHVAVMTLRSFVANMHSGLSAVDEVNPSLWEIQTVDGDSVSTQEASEVFSQLLMMVQ